MPDTLVGATPVGPVVGAAGRIHGDVRGGAADIALGEKAAVALPQQNCPINSDESATNELHVHCLARIGIPISEFAALSRR